MCIICRVTIDHLEGEVKVLKGSIIKLQNGLNKAEKDIQNQFKETVEVSFFLRVIAHDIFIL